MRNNKLQRHATQMCLKSTMLSETIQKIQIQKTDFIKCNSRKDKNYKGEKSG